MRVKNGAAPGETKVVKDWTFGAIDLTSGRGYALKTDRDLTEMAIAQLPDKVVFFQCDQKTQPQYYTYDATMHALGDAQPLPKSGHDYLPGLGFSERRNDEEVLLTDENLHVLEEPRALPRAPAPYEFRLTLLPRNRAPVWIIGSSAGADAVDLLLFDPRGGKTIYRHHFAVSMANVKGSCRAQWSNVVRIR